LLAGGTVSKDVWAVFEPASVGTIFLPKSAAFRNRFQIALLRVLQAREIERGGGNTSIPINVRVLAAAHAT